MYGYNTVPFRELIAQAREMRQKEYDKLSVLSSETIAEVTAHSLSSIGNDRGTNDPDTIVKIASLVYTLINLRKDHHTKLVEALNGLRCGRHESIAIFVSFVFAKVLKRAPKGSTRAKLDRCLQRLSSPEKALPAAFFLYFLAKHSPNSILLCVSPFINATTKAVLHVKTDVRVIGFESLRLYLPILDRSHIPRMLHQPLTLLCIAQRNMKNSNFNEQHGGFLVFTALLEFSPRVVGKQTHEFVRFFKNVLVGSAPEIKVLALHSLVLLSGLEKQLFIDSCLDEVADGLVQYGTVTLTDSIGSGSLLRLFNMFPSYFDTRFSSRLLEPVKTLLLKCEDAPRPNGFYLLRDIVHEIPTFMDKNIDTICLIVRQTRINSVYIEVVPTLFKQSARLWALFKGDFVPFVINELQALKSTELLLLVARCPSLESMEVISLLTDLLASPDTRIRGAVPQAFVAQSFQRTNFYEQTIFRMATLALSDQSPDVRVNVLSAFHPASYKMLTVDPVLSCFAALVKDDHFEVSNAAIRLLGELVSVNPYDVMPILRNLLLDNLFLLDSRRPLRIKEEMTRSFLTVISVTYAILPVYSSTLCDICLRQLSFTPTCELTYFEQRFIDSININITRVIGYIAKRDVSLIDPHIPQFVAFFFCLLQQHGPKKLKLALVKTLYVIMTHAEKVVGIDVKEIFAALEAVASKWNSRKLNVAVMKLMGFIGAVDTASDAPRTDNTVIHQEHLDHTSPNFFADTACKMLISVLVDDSLVIHQQNATRALVMIFCTDRTASVGHFDEFLPLLLQQIRKTKQAESVISLAGICGQAPAAWVRRYASELIRLVREFWGTHLLPRILELLPVLVSVLVSDFSPFVPECITFLLDRLYETRDSSYEISRGAIVAIASLRNIAFDYMFIVLPELIDCLSSDSALDDVKYDTLVCLRVFIQHHDATQFAPSLVRCILGVLESNDKRLRQEALNILYSLMARLGDLFAFFGEQVAVVLRRVGLLTPQFMMLHSSPTRKMEDFSFIDTSDPLSHVVESQEVVSDSDVDEAVIRESIAFTDEDTPWNWKEWYRAVMVVSIEQSPSPALRACGFLGASLFNIVDDVWQAAFFSIWLKLSQETQLFVAANLTQALLSSSLPGAISSSLVSLIDFMERTDDRMQISRQVLCQICLKSSQYAKCGYFVYKWYEEDSHNIEATETMIQVSRELGLTKRISGIATCLQADTVFTAPYTWCEKLGQWSMALKRHQEMEPSPSSLDGILRCLKHLQRWDEIIEMIPDFERLPEDTEKNDMAAIIATALFNRHQWSRLPAILDFCSDRSVRVLIIKALYQISQGAHQEALATVGTGFDVLSQNGRSVFKHDKTSLYRYLVKAQQLHEITEIANENSSIDVWRSRFALCRQSFDVYHQLLSVHLTVFKIEQLMTESIRMVKFALKANDFALFDSSLNFLFPDRSEWSAEVSFLHAKGTWAKGQQSEALTEIKGIIDQMPAENKMFRAKVFCVCGQWMLAMAQPGQLVQAIEGAAKFLERSIAEGVQYFHAWHRWAWACSTMYSCDTERVEYAGHAINGFRECVRQRPERSMSETMQMMSLFFGADLDDEAFEKASRRILMVKDSVLLSVMPQLFAQLPKEGTRTCDFVTSVIRKLLPNHFHVVLYPLLLIMRTGSAAATQLFKEFKMVNTAAATEAMLVSNNLVSCSISVLERWDDLLNSVIGQLQRNDIMGAQQALFAMIEAPGARGAYGANDVADEIGRMLPLAGSPGACLGRLRSIREKVSAVLDSTRTVSMHATAPSLSQLRNSVLAVPGTYTCNSEVTTIARIDPTLDIFHTKQRPRLMKIYGSDGNQYVSLLKGRQDVRLDQRVMMFFNLINQHVRHECPHDAEMMRIFTYTVVPLATTAGLVQFVKGADTMYILINDYRSRRGVTVFQELHIMEGITHANTNTLTPIQRLEALRQAAAETNDTDLREKMWVTSPSATEWISRSSRFTQSAALMSIVGYILGLGDRHPSNLMIHRFTGSVIHIDFADCFEINRNRVRFAETVPFRLTRMMRRAFGPIGIEGEFRLTCEQAAQLMRSHEDSLTAVLDIFMQEPVHVAPIGAIHADPDPEDSIRGSIDRVMNKIAGKEHDEEMTVQDHVSALIDSATDMYNLAHLYDGWTPLW